MNTIEIEGLDIFRTILRIKYIDLRRDVAGEKRKFEVMNLKLKLETI